MYLHRNSLGSGMLLKLRPQTAHYSSELITLAKMVGFAEAAVRSLFSGPRRIIGRFRPSRPKTI